MQPSSPIAPKALLAALLTVLAPMSLSRGTGRSRRSRPEKGAGDGRPESGASRRRIRFRRGFASLRSALQHHRDQASSGASSHAQQRRHRFRRSGQRAARPGPRRRTCKREQHQRAERECGLRLLFDPGIRFTLERAHSHRRGVGARDDLLSALQRRAHRSAEGPRWISLRKQPARGGREPGAKATLPREFAAIRRPTRDPSRPTRASSTGITERPTSRSPFASTDCSATRAVTETGKTVAPKRSILHSRGRSARTAD